VKEQEGAGPGGLVSTKLRVELNGRVRGTGGKVGRKQVGLINMWAESIHVAGDYPLLNLDSSVLTCQYLLSVVESRLCDPGEACSNLCSRDEHDNVIGIGAFGSCASEIHVFRGASIQEAP
jgi:hypothetical protein